MTEIVRYPFDLKQGENFELYCNIVEEAGNAFTISSANITIYNEDKSAVLTKANSDGDFTIDGGQLKYQLEVLAATFPEGDYVVKWDYTDSNSMVFIEQFAVKVVAVP